MQRLGINQGRYHGECIDIDSVLGRIGKLASASGWESVPVRVSEAESLAAYQRLVPNARCRLYISTGIHGDEPAGPLAVQRLFEQNDWPKDIDMWIVPCLNPHGFRQNCRQNGEGIDLNRDYREPKTNTVRAHVAWLQERLQFDFTLLLHEDWESDGFYLYELNLNGQAAYADRIIKAVSPVCPIDMSPTIEGRPAQNGVICANPDLLKRPDWPEAFYLVHHKTRLSYTLEAPSDFTLQTRVNALVAGVRAVF